MLILFHPQYPDRNYRSKLAIFLKRALCVLLAVTFLATNSDLAIAGELIPKKETSTLRPTNRFDAITSTEEEKILLERGFRETAEFLYVNKAICRAIAINFTDADELITWIREDLQGSRFNEFDYTKIYREGDSFYLPVKNKDAGSDILMRYFKLKGDETSPYIVKLTWHGVPSIGLEFLDAVSGAPVSSTNSAGVSEERLQARPTGDTSSGPEDIAAKVRSAIIDISDIYTDVKNVFPDSADSRDKRDRSPVTIADLLIQMRIALILNEHFPGEPLIAEENVDVAYIEKMFSIPKCVSLREKYSKYLDAYKKLASSRSAASTENASYWVLDPMDGTRNYIEGSGKFAISLAHIKFDKDSKHYRTDYALIYAPWYKTRYRRIDVEAPLVEFHKDRNTISLYGKALSGRTVLISDLHFDRKDDARKWQVIARQPKPSENLPPNPYTEMLADLYGSENVVEDWESSVIGMMEVLLGNYAVYCSDMFIWDHAAALAMIQAAGGMGYSTFGRHVIKGYTANDIKDGLAKRRFPILVSRSDKDLPMENIGPYAPDDVYYWHGVFSNAIKLWPVVLIAGLAVAAIVLSILFGHDLVQWLHAILKNTIDMSKISDSFGAALIPAFPAAMKRLGWIRSADVIKRVLFGTEYEFPADVYKNIRPALPSDAPSIHEIQTKFMRSTERVYSVEEYAKIAKDRALNLERGSYYLSVYEEGGVIKGYAMASYDGSSGVPTLSLGELVVVPEVREKGIGYTLTGRLLEAASENRVLRIEGIIESLYCAKIVLRFGLRCRHPNEDGTGVYTRDLAGDYSTSHANPKGRFAPDVYGYQEDSPIYGLRASQGLYAIVEEETGDSENTVNFRAITTDSRELGRVAISIDDIAWIEDAHVIPVAREKDVGEALMKRAFKYLRRIGKGKVLVYCEVDNPIAEFFYKGVAAKLGLTIETWQPNDNKEAVIFAYDIRDDNLTGGGADISSADEWLKENARLLSVDSLAHNAAALPADKKRVPGRHRRKTVRKSLRPIDIKIMQTIEKLVFEGIYPVQRSMIASQAGIAVSSLRARVRLCPDVREAVRMVGISSKEFRVREAIKSLRHSGVKRIYIQTIAKEAGIKPNTVLSCMANNKAVERLVKIAMAENRYLNMPDDDLRRMSYSIKTRLSKGDSIDNVLIDGMAIFIVMARRILGIVPYEEQIEAALMLHSGMAVQQLTGEGKTISIAMAAYVNALTGKGVHVHTANDYLAFRDAKIMGKVFTALDLEVGVIQPDPKPYYIFRRAIDGSMMEGRLNYKGKRAVYSADIVYGPSYKFIFDYLSDEWQADPSRKLQKDVRPEIVLVDEGDSILIDEAATPYVLSESTRNTLPISAYIEFYRLAVSFKNGVDYKTNPAANRVSLTREGEAKVARLALSATVSDGRRQLLMETALIAKEFYYRNRDYIIHNGRILIIDEFTGRPKFNSVWEGDLHPMIIAKEAGFIDKKFLDYPHSRVFNMISTQAYYGSFARLGVISGTIYPAARELKELYGLNTAVVPPTFPPLRTDNPIEVFDNTSERRAAVLRKLSESHAEGNPVLIGTTTIEEAESIARMIADKRGYPYNILTGRDLSREDEIIRDAGREGAITIAAGVTGRGTDIQLDHGVKKLVVILTQLDKNHRAYAQRRGRAGRQGQPGETFSYVSLDDPLFTAFIPSSRLNDLMYTDIDTLGPARNRAVRYVVGKSEEANRDGLSMALMYDGVIESHRRTLRHSRLPDGVNAGNIWKRYLNFVINKKHARHRWPEFEEAAKSYFIDLLSFNGPDDETVKTHGRAGHLRWLNGRFPVWAPLGGAGAIPLAGKFIFAGIVYLYACAHKEELLRWLRTKGDKDKWYSPYAANAALFLRYALLDLSRNKLTRYISSSFRRPIGYTISSEGFGDDRDEFNDPFSDRGPSAAAISGAIASMPPEDMIKLPAALDSVEAKRFYGLVAIARSVFSDKDEMQAVRKTLSSIRDPQGRTIFDYKEDVRELLDILDPSRAEIVMVRRHDPVSGDIMPWIAAGGDEGIAYYAESGADNTIYYSYGIFSSLWGRLEKEMWDNKKADDEYLRLAIAYMLEGAGLLAKKRGMSVPEPEVLTRLLCGDGSGARTRLGSALDRIAIDADRMIQRRRETIVSEMLAINDPDRLEIPRVQALLTELAGYGTYTDGIYKIIREKSLSLNFVKFLDLISERCGPHHPALKELSETIKAYNSRVAANAVSGSSRNPVAMARAYAGFPAPAVFKAALKALSQGSQDDCRNFSLELQRIDPAVRRHFCTMIDSFSETEAIPPDDIYDLTISALAVRYNLISITKEMVRRAMITDNVPVMKEEYLVYPNMEVLKLMLGQLEVHEPAHQSAAIHALNGIDDDKDSEDLVDKLSLISNDRQDRLSKQAANVMVFILNGSPKGRIRNQLARLKNDPYNVALEHALARNVRILLDTCAISSREDDGMSYLGEYIVSISHILGPDRIDAHLSDLIKESLYKVKFMMAQAERYGDTGLLHMARSILTMYRQKYPQDNDVTDKILAQIDDAIARLRRGDEPPTGGSWSAHNPYLILALIGLGAIYALYLATPLPLGLITGAVAGHVIPAMASVGGPFGLLIAASLIFTHAVTPPAKGSQASPPSDVYPGKVVVIGGSAFGWNAIARIIDDLPAHHPPIIIAEHISASEEDAAMGLVRRHRDKLFVYENGVNGNVADITLKPDTVLFAKYSAVIGRDPEGYPIVRVYPDMVQSFREDGGHHYMCIDRLFASAAEHFGAGAIGVVVSGRFVDDGLEGSRAITNGGGELLVQSIPPSLISAMFPMLPETVAQEMPAVKKIDAYNMATAIMECASKSLASPEGSQDDDSIINDLWGALSLDDESRIINFAAETEEFLRQRHPGDFVRVFIGYPYDIDKEVEKLFARYKGDRNYEDFNNAIGAILQNIQQHGGDYGALVLRFEKTGDKTARLHCVAMDYGHGFIDLASGKHAPIHEAVRHGVTFGGGNAGIGLTITSELLDHFAVTTVNDDNGASLAYYWHKNMDQEMRLTKAPVSHGTRAEGYKDVTLNEGLFAKSDESSLPTKKYSKDGVEANSQESWISQLVLRYDELMEKARKVQAMLDSEKRHGGKRGHLQREEALMRRLGNLESEIRRIRRTLDNNRISADRVTQTTWDVPAQAREPGVASEYTWSSGEPLFARLEYTADTLVNRHHRMIDMLARNLIPIVGHGCRMLDIGTGSGILTRALSESIPPGLEPRFVATDINPQALKDAGSNLAGVGNVDLRRGRSYEPIHSGEIFDIIFSNPPWYDTRKDTGRDSSAMVDEGRQTIREIVTGAVSHLAPDGRLFIIYPREYAEILAGLADESGMVMSEIDFYKTKRGGVGLYEFTKSAETPVGRNRPIRSIAALVGLGAIYAVICAISNQPTSAALMAGFSPILGIVLMSSLFLGASGKKTGDDSISEEKPLARTILRRGLTDEGVQRLQERLRAVHYKKDIPAISANDLATREKKIGLSLGRFCTSACPICWFAAPHIKPEALHGPAGRMSRKTLNRVIDMTKRKKISEIDLGGEGEPFLEFRNLLHLIRNARVDKIVLPTNGFWAQDEKKVIRYFKALTKAAEANPALKEIYIRISSDEHHNNDHEAATIVKRYLELRKRSNIVSPKINCEMLSVVGKYYAEFVAMMQDQLRSKSIIFSTTGYFANGLPNALGVMIDPREAMNRDDLREAFESADSMSWSALIPLPAGRGALRWPEISAVQTEFFGKAIAMPFDSYTVQRSIGRYPFYCHDGSITTYCGSNPLLATGTIFMTIAERMEAANNNPFLRAIKDGRIKELWRVAQSMVPDIGDDIPFEGTDINVMAFLLQQGDDVAEAILDYILKADRADGKIETGPLLSASQISGLKLRQAEPAVQAEDITEDEVEEELDKIAQDYEFADLFNAGLIDKSIVVSRIVSRCRILHDDKNELSKYMWRYVAALPDEDRRGLLERRNIAPEKMLVIEEADRILESYFADLEKNSGIHLPFGYLKLKDHATFWNGNKLRRYYGAPKALVDYILNIVIVSDSLPADELLTVLLHEGIHLNAHGFTAGLISGTPFDEGVTEYLTLDAMSHAGLSEEHFDIWQKRTKTWKRKEVEVIKAICGYMGGDGALIRAYFAGEIKGLPIIPITLSKGVVSGRTPVIYKGRSIFFDTARRRIIRDVAENIPNNRIYIKIERDKKGRVNVARFNTDKRMKSALSAGPDAIGRVLKRSFLNNGHPAESYYADPKNAALHAVTWANNPQAEVVHNRERFLAMLPQKSGIIVDAGTGTGRDAAYFNEKSKENSFGWRSIGTDKYQAQIEEARRVFSGTRFDVVGISDIDYGRESLVGWWSNQVLHHLPEEEAKKALKKAYDGLMPGGVIHFRTKLRRPGDAAETHDNKGRLNRVYTADEIRAWMDSTCFTDVDIAIQPDSSTANYQANDVDWICVFARKPLHAPASRVSQKGPSQDTPESVVRLIDQIKRCMQTSSCEYPVWLFGSAGVKGMNGATDIDLAVPSDVFNDKGYYPLKKKLLEEVFGMKDIGDAELESNEHVQVVALADLRISGHGWYPLRHKVVHRIEGNSTLAVRKLKDLYRIAGEDERVDTVELLTGVVTDQTDSASMSAPPRSANKRSGAKRYRPPVAEMRRELPPESSGLVNVGRNEISETGCGYLTISHVTTELRAQMMLDFGYYGVIDDPGGNFCVEDTISSIPRSWEHWKNWVAEWANLSHEGPRVVVVFKIPRNWISGEDITKVMERLSSDTRRESMPQGFIDSLERNKLTAAGNMVSLLDALQSAADRDKLGQIPPQSVDIEATIQYNVAIHGEAILNRPLMKRLLALRDGDSRGSASVKEVSLRQVEEPDGTVSVVIDKPRPPVAEMRRKLSSAPDNASRVSPNGPSPDMQYEKEASAFVHGLKRRAYKVREDAKKESGIIIVAVETNGYIPTEQKGMIQPLLRELTQERLGMDFAKTGLDNVRFVQGTGEALKSELLRVKSETGAKAKNVVVLGTKGTIDMLSGLSELRGETEEDGAFFAEMDTTEITGFQYIRLLQMLTIAIKAAYGERVSQSSYPMVEIKKVTKRFIRLIPKAEKVKSNNLPEIYKKQAETLQAA